MFGQLTSLLRSYSLKKRWRDLNRLNRTVLSRYTNIDLIHVGKGSYGELNVINHSKSYKVSIGNYCSIAPEVFFIVCGDHRTESISTFPFRATLGYCEFEALSKGDIIVEDDVWICFRATILSGVKIGRGAIVTAGAVVTNDVEPYTIVGGVPAKTIKHRFTPAQIEVLNKIDFRSIQETTVRDNIDLFYKTINPEDDLSWVDRILK